MKRTSLPKETIPQNPPGTPKEVSHQGLSFQEYLIAHAPQIPLPVNCNSLREAAITQARFAILYSQAVIDQLKNK